MQKKISIIIPVFNEDKNIGLLISELNKLIGSTSYLLEIIFVDDGSSDNTLNEIKKQAKLHLCVFFIELSKKFGKDYALKTGIEMASGDAIITMNADLQHPPELIPRLLALWEAGNDIVYTYRSDTNPDAGRYRRLTSGLFYKTVNALSEIKLENGIADFRILDKKVVLELKQMDEYEIFFKGTIKWVKFIQTGIRLTPSASYGGTQSYSLWKLIKPALSCILSVSVRPLYIAGCAGLLFSLLPVLYIPYVLISYFTGHAISIWASLIATLVFFGGLYLLLRSIIGLYIGKIFMHTKQRPNYIIHSTNILKLADDLIRV